MPPEDPAPDHYLGPKFPDYLPARERARADKAATARRLEREEAAVRRGLVAGHDFPREAAERQRGR